MPSSLRTHLVTVTLAAAALPAALLLVVSQKPLVFNVAAALVCLAAAAVLAWLFAGARLLRPARELAAAAHRLAAGERGVRVESRGSFEADGIARSLQDLDEAVTAREQELLNSEARFRSMVEEGPAILYVTRVESDTQEDYIAPQVGPLLGYSQMEWSAEPGLWTKLLHEDDRARVTAEFARAGAQAAPFVSEYRLVTRDGQPRWFRDCALPVCDASGKATHFRGVLLDITDRRTIEEQHLQAQKMDAVGRLASGIAHDFNNLLTVINGYCDLAMASPQASYLNEISLAGQRASALTRQLLAFSRKQPLQLSVLDLNAVVEQSRDMLARLVGEKVMLQTVHGERLGRVHADPAQIDQVLMNLAANARDALPNGGLLRIETSNASLSAEESAALVDVAPGAFVCLAVTDNGTGMGESTRARLFEPFFTTKEAGRGTGLGLATVYGIVRQSGGFIRVTSERGRGTSFRVYLPREDGIAAKSPPTTRPYSVAGGETILLLEDEQPVRQLISQILRGGGFRVLEASHGGQAVELAAKHEGRIDLLLSDSVVPDLSGTEVAKRLRQGRPEMRVMLMSGYLESAPKLAELGERTPSDFLQKPFSMDLLMARVRKLLSRRF